MTIRKKFDSDKAFGDKYELFRDTWNAYGFNEPTQSHLEFSDLMATPNATIWMPKVIEEIVREPGVRKHAYSRLCYRWSI